jgi:hypothetical protein
VRCPQLLQRVLAQYEILPGDMTARAKRNTLGRGNRAPVIGRALDLVPIPTFPIVAVSIGLDGNCPTAEVSAFREHFFYYGSPLGMLRIPALQGLVEYFVHEDANGETDRRMGPRRRMRCAFSRTEILVAARPQIFEQPGRLRWDNFARVS